ncbi:MAG: alginate export family protein [Myxococcota bacterium]
MQRTSFPPVLLAAALLLGFDPISVHAQEASADPPTDDPSWGLDLGGVLWRPTIQARPRIEVRVNEYRPGPADGYDPHFVTMRSRIGLEGRTGPVRGFVQVQDVRNWGQVGTTAVGGALTGLHQGYLELRDGERGFLRIGRQEVNYGKQRLVGALDWTSPARSFDAVRARGFFGDLEVETMGALLRSQQLLTTATDVLATEGDYMATLLLTYGPADWLRIEPYVLYLHGEGRIDEADNVVDRVRNLASPGIRVTGDVGSFDYDVELIFQSGKDRVNGAADTILAFAAITEIGYRLGGPLQAALRAGGAYASGASEGGEVDELENFFPTNHMHYGYADLFGLRNLIWGFARGDVAPRGAPLKAELTVHLFGLANPEARWSNAGGATLGQNPGNDDRFLGAEVDLQASWTPLPHFGLSGGYAVFVPAQGARNLDNDLIQHWMYLMADTKL